MNALRFGKHGWRGEGGKTHAPYCNSAPAMAIAAASLVKGSASNIQ
jgi:hypothetical protein